LIIDLTKPSIEEARVDASAKARIAELSVIVPAYRVGDYGSIVLYRNERGSGGDTGS